VSTDVTTSGTAEDGSETLHPADIEAVVLARTIRDQETVFVGVNSPVPMAAALMAKATHAPHARLITIAGGIDPLPGRPDTAATSSPRYAEGSVALLDNLAFYDLVGRGGIDLTFLGGAQIDRAGRVNSSFLGDQRKPDVRFPGGGGAAFILPLAGRVVIWRAAHDRRIFVEEIGFVTATGHLDAVVTPLCVLGMDQGRLDLRSVHAGTDPSEVRAATGFQLRADPWPQTPAPTVEELTALRQADPEGIRFSEFTR
jgi:glutaconate CoA-transferase subunit B